MLTIRRCEFVKPVILVATVTYFVVAVNNKQIDSLYDSFIVNTTSRDTRAVCKLASVKTRQIHHTVIIIIIIITIIIILVLILGFISFSIKVCLREKYL